MNVQLHEGLEKIEAKAFCECQSLDKIIIPTIKVIDEQAFRRCFGLIDVEFCRRLEMIGESAFCQCNSLHCIMIPSSVKIIDGWAFLACSILSSVELREGLLVIQKDAFCKCNSLQSINVPSSVKEIDKDAFSECPQLTVDTCEVLWGHRRVCFWRVNAGLVESWDSCIVSYYILFFCLMQYSRVY